MCDAGLIIWQSSFPVGACIDGTFAENVQKMETPVLIDDV
jgi:hypothetical protein